MNDEISDIDLWLRIKDADIKAFTILMNRYWPTLFNKAMSRVNDSGAAKDLVQEVLISVWINRHKLPENVIPKAYLFSSVKYKVLNFLSYNDMRLNKANILLQHKQNEVNATPEDIIDVRELKNIISESTSRMTESMREVFELSYEEGLSIAEIATRKKISAQSVKNYLYEAKSIVKKRLGELSYLTPEHLTGLLAVILMKH
jgi:RNA polymerase sigma factor (sigma-70 family)